MAKGKSVKPGEWNIGDRVILNDVDPMPMNISNNSFSGFHPSNLLEVLGTVVHIADKNVISVKRDDGFTGSGWQGAWTVVWDFSSNQWSDNCRRISSSEKKESRKDVKIDLKALKPLVIAESSKNDIIAVLKQHEHTSVIFEEWGLGETIQYGKGMTMLFHGGPGTGKTWAAHCIAKAMKIELMSIGSAELQSYMAGETQKNVQNAFKAATSGNKLLFLDECDSLITSRNDVGMIIGSEINTLLTEIEKFEGVCILATNRIDTLDEALERRLSLILEFSEPDFAARAEIWAHIIPSKMPLEKDVSIEKLAEYALTGGQIKNVILQAARIAAAEGHKKVPFEAFERSVKRVNDSKSLMGKRSRKRQAREDYHMSSDAH